MGQKIHQQLYCRSNLRILQVIRLLTNPTERFRKMCNLDSSPILSSNPMTANTHSNLYPMMNWSVREFENTFQLRI